MLSSNTFEPQTECGKQPQKFSYAKKQTIALTAPIFIKLIWSRIESYLKRRKILKIGQNFIHTLTENMHFTAIIFTKVLTARQLFLRNSYTKFRKNPTNCFVPHTVTDERMGEWAGKRGSTYGFLIFFFTSQRKAKTITIWQILLRRRYTSNRTQGSSSHKSVSFTVTDVRTLNLTNRSWFPKQHKPTGLCIGNWSVCCVRQNCMFNYCFDKFQT
jgi:hypothetical protein